MNAPTRSLRSGGYIVHLADVLLERPDVVREVYPTVPTRKDCPPEQVNLDRVLDFVLD